MRTTRRSVLRLAGLGAASALLPSGAKAQDIESHGLSLFGDLKYPRDFPHFDYVNPNAPKGGTFSQQVSAVTLNRTFDTFDSLHVHILKGNGAAGVERCYASLMDRALDEPDAVYGLAAESVQVSADRLTYRFKLRSGLTFHDGSPLTAEDVAWSCNILKSKGHPSLSQPLQDMLTADAEAADLLRVTFASTRSRDLPLYIAALPIFSKAWWAQRDFERSSLEIPLGSGAYKIGRFDPGSWIELDRVEAWWGAALPSQIGINNFDRLRWDYFADADVAFQAFKAKAFLFREERISRFWATGYDFPAFREGRVKREELPDLTLSGAQGWHINTRREKFKDPRVRQALGLAFDFEWTNKNLMFGSYARTISVFQNSDFMASGPPTADELKLLDPLRGVLSPLVFGEPVVPPVSDGSGEDRKLLSQATDLLRQAGWTIEAGVLKNEGGDNFSIEFLDDEASLERHTAPFIKNLTRLGIAASYRVIDPAQFSSRVDNFDFDIIVRRSAFNSTPGESVRNLWSSQSATITGSGNYAGIADPAVDALLEKILNAENRDALRVACRALDRILRAGFYWIPQWNKASHWLAYWDFFEHPAEKPRYARGAPETWWAKV